MTLSINVFCMKGGQLPLYATDKAAGADLFANLDGKSVTLEVGQRELIPTGIIIELPDGYEAQVRSRSGLAHRHGVAVLNSPGTIDSDYRGEIKVILINLGDKPFTINDKERIAQLIIAPVSRCSFNQVVQLTTTQRGEKGFGSTGV